MTGVTAGELRRAVAPFVRAESFWVGLYAFLLLAERLFLVGTALWLLHGSAAATTISAMVLGITVIVRASVHTTLSRRIQAALHRSAVDKLLEGDLLSASALSNADTEASIIEGIWSGIRLIAGIVPELAADALAAAMVGVILLAVEPPRLLWVGGIALFFAAVAVLLSKRVARREEEHSWSAYGPVVDGLVVAIGARLEVVANGVSDSFRAQRRSEIAQWEKAAYRSTLLIGLASRLPMGVAIFVVGVILVVERSLRGDLTGAMVAHAALFGASLPAAAGLGRNLLDVTRQGVRFASFAALLESSAVPSGAGTRDVSLPARVTWENVSVRYAGAETRALSDVQLIWEPGAVLVLRGANGSGKSTLLRTLLAVASLEAGVVRGDGVDLMELELAAWRKGIAYLAQRPFVPVRGSVHDAFAIVAPDATTAKIEQALQRVGLLRVLTRRSAEAPLSVDVGALSVGERQRLALARVLTSDKPLLLLDEPDANLDRAGIELLAAFVRELAKEGRMIAIAAHTDEIVALGDRVVSLESGRVVAVEDR